MSLVQLSHSPVGEHIEINDKNSTNCMKYQQKCVRLGPKVGDDQSHVYTYSGGDPTCLCPIVFLLLICETRLATCMLILETRSDGCFSIQTIIKQRTNIYNKTGSRALIWNEACELSDLKLLVGSGQAGARLMIHTIHHLWSILHNFII